MKGKQSDNIQKKGMETPQVPFKGHHHIKLARSKRGPPQTAPPLGALMKKLELVTVHFEDFANNFIFNLNCAMGKTLVIKKGPSHIDRSLPKLSLKRELYKITFWPIWISFLRILES